VNRREAARERDRCDQQGAGCHKRPCLAHGCLDRLIDRAYRKTGSVSKS
jgi:hypothetical protein